MIFLLCQKKHNPSYPKCSLRSLIWLKCGVHESLSNKPSKHIKRCKVVTDSGTRDKTHTQLRAVFCSVCDCVWRDLRVSKSWTTFKFNFFVGKELLIWDHSLALSPSYYASTEGDHTRRCNVSVLRSRQFSTQCRWGQKSFSVGNFQHDRVDTLGFIKNVIHFLFAGNHPRKNQQSIILSSSCRALSDEGELAFWRQGFWNEDFELL